MNKEAEKRRRERIMSNVTKEKGSNRERKERRKRKRKRWRKKERQKEIKKMED